MLTFSVESFVAIYSEMQPLIQVHWREVAIDQDRFPLKVDTNFYVTCEANGTLLTVAAREEGKLCGYCLVFIKEHPRYGVPVAVTDVYYLAPGPGLTTPLRYRDMFRFVEQAAANRGAKKFTLQLKVHRAALRSLFASLGYQHIEEVYAKTIGA